MPFFGLENGFMLSLLEICQEGDVQELSIETRAGDKLERVEVWISDGALHVSVK